MSLFYQHNINETTKLAVWKIEEQEDFFLKYVPLQKEITHPHKRLQHLAGRYLLQNLFPDFPIHLIQVADTRKPYLKSESHHFSISHCGDYAAVIVSTERRVGIDIELHTERIFTIMHKFLNEHELIMEQGLGHIYPTIVWSCKEAMYKWYSKGEIDFQEHLQLKNITPESSDSGLVKAMVNREEPVQLDLLYRKWGNLVLTWVYM